MKISHLGLGFARRADTYAVSALVTKKICALKKVFLCTDGLLLVGQTLCSQWAPVEFSIYSAPKPEAALRGAHSQILYQS
jgi:hypothetical protein